jgi:hypothetical protein
MIYMVHCNSYFTYTSNQSSQNFFKKYDNTKHPQIPLRPIDFTRNSFRRGIYQNNP